MTDFQHAVLDILSKADEPLGWYQIERRLSNVALEQRPHLLDQLGLLRDLGWVGEIEASEDPKRRYVITESGRDAINHAS